MRLPCPRTARVAVLAVLGGATLFGACASAGPPRPLTPAQLAIRDGGIPPYTKADVEFMQGMIGHHAQAVTMSSFAEPNGASSEVRVLAGRIAVAQTDEMDFMEDWLRTRKQTVPPRDGAHHHHAGMDMSGASGQMPGMLSPAQMDTLARARGPAFDWYFLTYMIQHHRGAITMVDALMQARSAANDDNVFKFVSDVVADQSTEIARMELLLKTRPKP
ncbi:MAG: DUF305 domain-containing protein [Gemmatimonas sp.]|jgi:uncharacterized protein (DUF305 family)|uniref:DUF305 domain-containing protein n=1 Tax=Gemmatimonas sp. TaxID=1962908 RepID=UPI00391F5FE0|nr:DUF305 domain-containing protein [Gemmatimonadota bacterium]